MEFDLIRFAEYSEFGPINGVAHVRQSVRQSIPELGLFHFGKHSQWLICFDNNLIGLPLDALLCYIEVDTRRVQRGELTPTGLRGGVVDSTVRWALTSASSTME